MCRLAYRSGVTTAITAPTGSGFLRGISTAFRLGAPHVLSRAAIIQQETAVHVSLSFSQKASVSTQVATLRTLLLGEAKASGQIGVAVTKIREVGAIHYTFSYVNLTRLLLGKSALSGLCRKCRYHGHAAPAEDRLRKVNGEYTQAHILGCFGSPPSSGRDRRCWCQRYFDVAETVSRDLGKKENVSTLR